MSYLASDEADYPRLTRAVRWLIAVNVAVFFVQITVVGSENMQSALGFETRDLSTSWWTIVTYMFVHMGFLHIALNMYTLFLFGPRLEHAWTPAEFVRYYVICGLGGWFLHLVVARDGLLLGASAAVYGVMIAYAMRWPNDEVYLFGVLPIKVKWLVTAMVIINLVAGLSPSGRGSGVAYMAHLGGLAAGWLYLRIAGMSGISRLRQRVSPVPDVSDETPRAIPRSLPRQREKGNDIDDIIARSKAAIAQQQVGAPPLGRKEGKRPNDLDIVLDKISQHGIDSLTRDERRLLEDLSKELRRKS
jgi:membrane associated rhomboid family serine protease